MGKDSDTNAVRSQARIVDLASRIEHTFALRQEHQLRASDWAVLLYVAYRDAGAGCFASVPTMSREMGFDRRTIDGALSRLVDLGVISKDATRNGSANRYRFAPTIRKNVDGPYTKMTIPINEEPHIQKCIRSVHKNEEQNRKEPTPVGVVGSCEEHTRLLALRRDSRLVALTAHEWVCGERPHGERRPRIIEVATKITDISIRDDSYAKAWHKWCAERFDKGFAPRDESRQLQNLHGFAVFIFVTAKKRRITASWLDEQWQHRIWAPPQSIHIDSRYRLYLLRDAKERNDAAWRTARQTKNFNDLADYIAQSDIVEHCLQQYSHPDDYSSYTNVPRHWWRKEPENSRILGGFLRLLLAERRAAMEQHTDWPAFRLSTPRPSVGERRSVRVCHNPRLNAVAITRIARLLALYEDEDGGLSILANIVE